MSRSYKVGDMVIVSVPRGGRVFEVKGRIASARHSSAHGELVYRVPFVWPPGWGHSAGTQDAYILPASYLRPAVGLLDI